MSEVAPSSCGLMLKAHDMMSRRNRRRHLQTETVLDQFEDHLLGLLAKAREQQSRVRNYLTFEELEQRVRRKLLVQGYAELAEEAKRIQREFH